MLKKQETQAEQEKRKSLEPDIQPEEMDCFFDCTFTSNSLLKLHQHIFTKHHGNKKNSQSFIFKVYKLLIPKTYCLMSKFLGSVLILFFFSFPEPHDFGCRICKNKLSDHHAYKTHQKSHLNQKKFQCNVCNAKFNLKCMLDAHTSSHKEKQFSCNVCGQTFTRKTEIDKHIAQAHTSTAFKCKYCNASFSSIHYLNAHNQTFHPDTVYDSMCSICGQLLTKNHVKAHEDGHRGDAVHECGHCRARFNTAQKASVHRKMHKGPDAFWYCPLCAKKFKNQVEYDNDFLMHEKELWGPNVVDLDAGPSHNDSSSDPKPSTSKQ